MLKFNKIDSTHLLAKRMIDDFSINLPEVIIAKEQTSGLTRKSDIQWDSVSGNLYMNIVVDNLIKSHEFQFLISSFLSDFLDKKFNLNTKCKWPNDIIVNDKKICGILCEEYKGSFLIGIGLNISTHPVITHNLEATCLFHEYKEFDVDVFELGNEIFTEFIDELSLFRHSNDGQWLLNRFINKVWKLGEKVFLTSLNKKVVFKSINSNGFMICEDENGRRFEVASTDIRLT